MKKDIQSYPNGIQGDYLLLLDVGETCDYLMEVLRELHGRIFPQMTYARSLLTSAELEERLSSARLLMEVLYPSLSLWERLGLGNGLQANSHSSLFVNYSEADTCWETETNLPDIGA